MMNLKELADFCRRMGIGLRAGVDILRVIQNEEKVGRAAHKQAMANVYKQIRAGDTLADAMKAQDKHFPKLLIQMVHASELGGRVDSIFTYMAGYYETLKQTRNGFIQKISWPLIQLAMAVGIIGLVILIQGILSPNSTYDASALGLRGFGGFITYCAVVTVVFSSIGIILYGIWKNWFQCHTYLTPIVQRIPKLGTAIITLSLSRLSMTLSLLLNSGLDAKHAVKQAFLSTGNQYFIGGMERAVGEIDRGASFGDAFEKSEVLPAEFVDAIRIGEISGTETESLDHLASDYQLRAASALGTIATIASMVVWLGIMLFIGFIILRMAFQYLNIINKAINDPMGDW